MSKLKSPPEKKEAAYDREHYTFAWFSPHGFRKTWKKKKNQMNRLVRRKSRHLLHTAESEGLRAGRAEDEPFSSELFRVGLIKKRLRKSGVVSLRNKVRARKESRQSRGFANREFKERMAAAYIQGIRDLERNQYTHEAELLVLELNAGSFRLWTFFENHPGWRARLRKKIEEIQKQHRALAERKRLKTEQKRKWRSMNSRARYAPEDP